MTARDWAYRIWPILTFAASKHMLLTYEQLARLVGTVPPALEEYLSPIQAYCQREGLPPLTSIVVSKRTGAPGSGFSASANVPQAQADVFNCDWLGTKVPMAKDLS